MDDAQYLAQAVRATAPDAAAEVAVPAAVPDASSAPSEVVAAPSLELDMSAVPPRKTAPEPSSEPLVRPVATRVSAPHSAGLAPANAPLAAAAQRASAAAPRASGVVRVSAGMRPVAQAVPLARTSATPGWAMYVPPELRGLLRVGVQLGVAACVFFAGTALRAWSGRDDVDEALAAWQAQPAGAAATEAAQPPPAAGSAGKHEAVLWAAAELHQFSNGDKDVVRALVERVTASGAVVTVGGLMQSGPITVASELHIALPSDVAKRRTIYELLRAFRRDTWHSDPGENTATDPFAGRTSIMFELS
jgi:hypothetical protein